MQNQVVSFSLTPSEAARALKAEKATEEATKAAQEAAKAAQEAEKAVQRLSESLERNRAIRKLMNEERKARTRLRDFVRQSLSDILAGVDDAAVEARSRQLEGGLDESGFIASGRLGSLTSRRRESIVEFDLAVVSGKQVSHSRHEGGSRKLGIEGSTSVMNVIGLGFSAGAVSRVWNEKRNELRSDVSHHNRVRFTVPVTFASLDDPDE